MIVVHLLARRATETLLFLIRGPLIGDENFGLYLGLSAKIPTSGLDEVLVAF